MTRLLLLPFIILGYFQVFCQVTQTANDVIEPYQRSFRPASNIGYYPPFTNEELANLAAGNESEDVNGLGIKTLRPVLHEAFLEKFGYDFFKPTFEHYKQVGLEESTVVVGFPSAEHQDPNYYCEEIQSALFDNLYTDIWDNGENGTPVNDENYYALYLYKMVENYKDDIRFWEIWNEPGFDYTRTKGFLPPGEAGNWWENNPEPCDYKLRAPIFHYIRMLRISYEIIHTFDPDSYVTVSGVGFPSFLDAILRNTDNPNDGSTNNDYPLKGGAYFDVIGYHSYPHFDGNLKVWDPATSSFIYSRHSDAASESIAKSKNDLQDVLDNYGYDGNTFPEKHWTITEVNLPRKQISDYIGGEEVQRNFLIKSYVEAVKLNILQLHFYQLAEKADDENSGDEFYYMGLYKNLKQNNLYAQELTEGGIGIKTCSDELFGKTYDQTRTNELQLGNQINGAAFFDINNNYTYVLWAKTSEDMSEQADASYSFPSSLNVGNLRSRSWDFSDNKNESNISSQNISLSAAPIFLSESEFSFTPTACRGEGVNFQASNMDNELNYAWTFEGGSPSTSGNQNPSVTFNSAGTFEISLEVTDLIGNVLGSQTDKIEILNAPAAPFISQVSGQVVVFSSFSNSNTLDYDWDFGDGQSSAVANPTHVYSNAGTFDVELTVSNECGTSSFENSVVISQPNDPPISSSANDAILPYDGYFRPGSNLGYYGLQWEDEMLADLASGNPRENIPGAGVKALRPSLPENFLETYGYDFRLETFEHYQNIGNLDNTLIVGFPSTAHRDQVNHCQSKQSELFASMYEDIWDNGENGTPVNDDNYFALYLYNTAVLYKDYVKFWEIWNEPGFDFTNIKGFLPPGEPGNWWDNDPDPCDYKLRAPVQYMVRMLRISYEVIKSVDEDAFITFSGIGFPSFLDAVLRNTDNPEEGAVSANYPMTGGAYFDVVGFHSYPNFDGSLRSYDSNISGFIYDRNSDAAANGILKSQADFQSVLDQYGYDGNTYPEKHWIITECNIPRKDFAGALGGEDVQINYVIKTLVKSKVADLLQLHMYKIAEEESIADATNEFQSMGLYEAIKDIQPSEQIINGEGIAFKTASDQLFLTTYDEAKTTAMNLPANIDGAAFVDPNGSYTYVLWAKTTSDLSEMAAANYSFPTSFNIDELIIKEWDFAVDDNTSVTDGENIALTGRPIFLSESLEAPSLPLALFDVDQSEGCFPLTVTYSSFSETGDDLLWQFPGGTPANSTAQNPTVTYDDPGTYAASLLVTNAFGEHSATETAAVLVKDLPKFSYTYDIQDRTVNFQSTFSNGSNLLWEFGDGNTSAGYNPSYTYPADGTYTFSLSVTNECGTKTLSETIAFGPTLLANNTSGCAPLTTSFTANEANIESVLWTFPGGEPATSNELEPIVTYNNSGTFNVTLEVTTSEGTETFTETNLVQVAQSPEPSFEMELNLPKVKFINNSNFANSYTWQFGGNGSSQAYSPTQVFPQNGEYEIELTAFNACGSESETQTLNIQEAPIVAFTASKTADCKYFSSYFVDESTYGTDDRIWIFEGGIPYTSTEQSIVVSYPNPGTYNVALIVKNQYGSGQAVFYDMIVHEEDEPTAEFDHQKVGREVIFENLSSTNADYLWDFGDGHNSTSQNPIHEYAEGGTYTITLTVDNGCGTDEFSQTISTGPSAFFEYTVEPDCLPLVVHFEDKSIGGVSSRSWSFPGGNPSSSTSTNPTVTYNTAGTFDVSLDVTNQNGTDNYTESNIIVAGTEPDASFSIFVEDRKVTFTPDDLTADAYFWEFGDGETSNDVQPVHTYNDLGMYPATLTMTNACGFDDHLVMVNLNGAPFPAFSSSTSSGCAPLEIDFFDQSGGQVDLWQWSFPGGNPSSSNTANPKVRYDNPGVYPVTLTVFNGADSNVRIETSYVEVLGAPDINIQSQVNGNQVTFTSSDENQEGYIWLFGDGNRSSEVSPTHTYFYSGEYEVTLEVETNCGFFEYTEFVSVSIEPKTYFASDKNSACGSLEVQFYDLSSPDVSSWDWSFPGGTPASSTMQNPIVSYNEVGSYPVTLTTTNAAGSSTTEIVDFINVYEDPVADFDYVMENSDGAVLVDFTNTSKGAATYLWDFGEGPWTADTENTFHVYEESGEYIVTLTIENDCGTNTIIKTIIITVVATEDHSLNGAFEIFPNPNGGNFILIGEAIIADKLDVSLSNLLGQQIETRQLNILDNKLNERFELSRLPKGTYILKLFADGKQNTFKIIIAE